MTEITQLLRRLSEGDESAKESLMSAVYPLLKDAARRQLGRSGGALTLQATDLLHSAYERLKLDSEPQWQNRSHFIGIVNVLIRNTLIDHLRRRSSEKRGGGQASSTLDSDELDAVDPSASPESATRLDEALARLSEVDPACAQVVLLKVFAGYQTDEIAQALDSSVATVGRQWRFARAWLADNL